MQPNLKSYNVTALELSTTIPLSSELISKIRDASKPDKDGDSCFYDSYQNHKAMAVVKGAKREASKYEILLLYAVVRSRKTFENASQIKQFFKILSSRKDKQTFECTVAFTFGKNLHPRAIINLPTKYIEAPNMPFDRIQGLHLVKFGGKEAKYEVFLDAPSQGTLFENVVFRFMSAFDESLPDRVLAKAKSVSDQIVFKGNKDAKNSK